MNKNWDVKKRVRISSLGVLFAISSSRMKRIWTLSCRGVQRFLMINFLDLVRWNPEIGCLRKERAVREEWVRLIGLPLRLWCKQLFKGMNYCKKLKYKK